MNPENVRNIQFYIHQIIMLAAIIIMGIVGGVYLMYSTNQLFLPLLLIIGGVGTVAPFSYALNEFERKIEDERIADMLIEKVRKAHNEDEDPLTPHLFKFGKEEEWKKEV